MEIKPLIKSNFVVLNNDNTISEMIGKLKSSGSDVGLVFRKNKYLGLVGKKKLLKSKIDTTKAKIKNVLENTPIISENADIIETAYLMHQSNLKYLPVESNKHIIGVLSSLDLLSLAVNLPETKGYKIKDVKLTKPSKIRKNDPVATAIKIMHDEKIDQVPVFDKNTIYGIVTFGDLLKRYLNWPNKKSIAAKFNIFTNSRGSEADMPKLASLPVSDFSTNYNLMTIDKSKSLKNAVNLMTKKRINDLMVMSGGEFQGLLTTKNILKKIGSLKIPKKFRLEFIGLNKLKLLPHQKYNLKKIATNEAFKLQRKYNNEMLLIIHVKEYDKSGNRQKYSVHLRIEAPGQIVSTSQEDWDFETALRKTFNNSKNKVKKKFRGDSSWRKSYE